MPYIKQTERPALDSIIDTLFKELREDFKEGQLNYVIFRLCGMLFKARSNYATVNKLNGVLTSVQNELNRRLFDPYENTKISENGDVNLESSR